jgi:hypothetical protein
MYCLFVTNYLQTVAATLQGRPAQVAPPVASALSATSVIVNWTVPGLPNGQITNYTIVQMAPQQRIATTISADSQLFTFTANGRNKPKPEFLFLHTALCASIFVLLLS